MYLLQCHNAELVVKGEVAEIGNIVLCSETKVLTTRQTPHSDGTQSFLGNLSTHCSVFLRLSSTHTCITVINNVILHGRNSNQTQGAEELTLQRLFYNNNNNITGVAFI